MATLQNSRLQLLCAFQLLLLLLTRVSCYQYKVGDLDAWGVPSAANPHVYTNWSKNHAFKIGDSLLFLYPPSQDSVIQVTEQSFDACNLTDPMLYMNDGNSLFNVTSPGIYYFTSAVPGHCDKKQKLQISVLSGNVSSSPSPSAFSPSSALPDSSYPTVFGSIPAANSSSSSSSPSLDPLLLAALMGFMSLDLITGRM